MSTSHKIAIIEDDIAIVQMYRIKFEAEGYRVAFASNGEEGLAMLEQFLPDMVLLDLMMPVMDGIEMLKQLREKPWGRNMRVIVLTNIGESEVPDPIKHLGVEKLIVKADMTPKEVASLVKEVLATNTN